MTSPKSRKRLTDRFVSAVKPTGKQQRFSDGGGLYLLVAPSGTKSYMLRVVVHGRRQDIGLGGTEVCSLTEARDEAQRLRKIARAGGDPRATRHAERHRTAVPTFEAAARTYHGKHAPSFKNAKHRQQWINSLNMVFPAFGGKPINTVTATDIEDAIFPHWRNTHETARRVLQRVGAVLKWAKSRGFYTGDNPVEAVLENLPKHRVAPKHHAALPHAQLPAFLDELRQGDSAKIVRLAMEFMILTAARSGEVRLAAWNEFDLEQRVWTVPASRMKANREHRVPLSPRCVEILEKARQIAVDKPLVFPGRQPKKPLSENTFVKALRKVGFGDITAHGFRSTFRDWIEDRTHFPRAVAEAALAHSLKDKVEAAYRRTDLFEKRRELMNVWATFATTPTTPAVFSTAAGGA